jgi:hypothetical protein
MPVSVGAPATAPLRTALRILAPGELGGFEEG